MSSKYLTSSLCLILAVTLAGCGDVGTAGLANQRLEHSGSPFRMEQGSGRRLLDLPVGATKADATTRADVLAQIAKVNGDDGVRWTGSEPVEVRLMPDGREVWIFPDATAAGAGVAFVVAFKVSPQGGTDIHMEGPTRFQR